MASNSQQAVHGFLAVKQNPPKGGFFRGLQQIAGESLVYARAQRPFSSIEDLARRVPELSQGNLRMLAQIGALNKIGAGTKLHRRDALWQVEKAGKKVGRLLEGIMDRDATSPLAQMNTEERLVSDYHGTGMTTGPHPMFYGEKRCAI